MDNGGLIRVDTPSELFVVMADDDGANGNNKARNDNAVSAGSFKELGNDIVARKQYMAATDSLP